MKTEVVRRFTDQPQRDRINQNMHSRHVANSEQLDVEIKILKKRKS